MLYIKHYHEKNLISDRRKSEAILNVAWAEFAEGPILKACDRLLVHWQAGMRLGSEVKWHAFFQKAIVALNDRCNGEMQSRCDPWRKKGNQDAGRLARRQASSCAYCRREQCIMYTYLQVRKNLSV